MAADTARAVQGWQRALRRAPLAGGHPRRVGGDVVAGVDREEGEPGRDARVDVGEQLPIAAAAVEEIPGDGVGPACRRRGDHLIERAFRVMQMRRHRAVVAQPGSRISRAVHGMTQRPARAVK